MANWEAWGKLIGPALPLGPIRIGRCEIGPRSGSVPITPVMPAIHPSGSRPFLHVQAASLEANSECWFVVKDIQAPNPDAAYLLAESEVVPPFVAALSAYFGDHPFRVQLLGVQGPGGGYSYSTVQAFLEFEPTTLEPEDAIEALGAWQDAFAGCDHLRSAANSLARGISLFDLAGGANTTASAVLAFYQTIESCSLVAPWTPPEDYDAQRTESVRILKAALDSRKTINKKVAAVETANRALLRLDAKYASLRIEHAARSFDLPAEWVRRTRELAKLRNSRLGHGAPSLSAADLTTWEHGTYSSESAYGLATRMLAAAVRFHLR